MIQDFDREFEKFVANDGKSVISEIHSIIPSLSQEQLKIYCALFYYISKYELEDLREFLNTYQQMIKQNKNLNLMKSMNMKSLLKAYSMEEYMRGIKISSQQVNQGEN